MSQIHKCYYTPWHLYREMLSAIFQFSFQVYFTLKIMLMSNVSCFERCNAVIDMSARCTALQVTSRLSHVVTAPVRSV